MITGAFPRILEEGMRTTRLDQWRSNWSAIAEVELMQSNEITSKERATADIVLFLDRAGRSLKGTGAESSGHFDAKRRLSLRINSSTQRDRLSLGTYHSYRQN